MKFIYIPLVLSISSLFAVEIEIRTDASINQATAKEISMLQANYMQQRIQINNEDAANVIQENRYLSEEYLKNKKVPEDVMVNMKLEFEKYLALKVTQKMQKKIKISEDILKSYYIANKEEFSQAKKIDLEIYRFEDYEAGMNFYMKFKNQQNNLEQYSKEENLTVTVQETEFPRLNRMFQDMMKYQDVTAPYMLPPQFFYDHYSVLYIKKITQEGIKPFEKIQEKIEKILHQKSFNKIKKELLAPYHIAEEQ